MYPYQYASYVSPAYQIPSTRHIPTPSFNPVYQTQSVIRPLGQSMAPTQFPVMQQPPAEVVKGESRTEYIPIKKEVVEFETQKVDVQVPKTRVVTDYYPYEVQTEYVPYYTYETKTEMVPVEKIVPKIEYQAVEKYVPQGPPSQDAPPKTPIQPPTGLTLGYSTFYPQQYGQPYNYSYLSPYPQNGQIFDSRYLPYLSVQKQASSQQKQPQSNSSQSQKSQKNQKHSSQQRSQIPQGSQQPNQSQRPQQPALQPQSFVTKQ